MGKGGQAMEFSNDLKSPTQHPVGYAWFIPSLPATFNVVLLLNVSGVFFAFLWLALSGEWDFALVTGLLFLVTFSSLLSLNFSDTGSILPMSSLLTYITWMYRKAFQILRCPHCFFHHPPRTFHCVYCNICVEESYHHCRWVNNCMWHGNIRQILLLLGSLCLYLGALLVTCVIFLVHPRDMPLSLDKAMTCPCSPQDPHWKQQQFVEGGAGSQGHDNPFEEGCTRNCYLTLCAPLGHKYQSETVWLQREEGTEWVPMGALQSPRYSPAHHLTHLPGPNFQTMDFDSCGQGPPGSGEAAPLRVGLVLELKHLEPKKQDYGPGRHRVQVTGLQHTLRCPWIDKEKDGTAN
uniref:Palmitoyltransferase n=1 Tax=Marmota marmota marmota TaxID=9994 RepID=A0A8C5YT29_MARMA